MPSRVSTPCVQQWRSTNSRLGMDPCLRNDHDSGTNVIPKLSYESQASSHSKRRVITEACIPTTPSINDFIVMDSRLECCSSVHDVTGTDYGGDCVIPAIKWRALLLVSSACMEALVCSNRLHGMKQSVK